MKSPSPSSQNPPSRSPRRWTSCIAAIAAFGLSAPWAMAFIPITSGNGSYSQDFNTLITTSNTAWTDNSTLTGWHAQRTGTGTTIVANNGSSNSGALYSYGNGTSTDRALGSIGSSGAGNFAWGAHFRNESGAPIEINSLQFTGEQWRNGASTTAAQTVTLWYQIAANPITTLTPNNNAGWTALTAGDFTSPVFGATGAALDGDAPANQQAVSINPNIVVPNGQYVMIRWNDPDHTGSDHGMAIDGFSISHIVTNADLINPTLQTTSPADGDSAAIINTKLVLTYDEPIKAGNGTVTIRKSSDNSLVETITIPSAQFSSLGSSAILSPTAILENNTGYYVEMSAGAITDLSNNPAPAISGNSTWNFTTRGTPAVVISQYYEGLGNDKYIELKNLTGSALSLDGYELMVWGNAARDLWKSSNKGTTSYTDLSGFEIPANGYFLIKDNGATAPVYAANNSDTGGSGQNTGVAFSGDDSVVLYKGPGYTQAQVVDAVSFTANQGPDISFYRLNNGPSFDFAPGTSIWNYPSVWGTKTLAEVASALSSDAWYLSATVPIETLTFNISPSSVAESAGLAAATATVTRSGDTTNSLTVIIESNKPGAADSELSVEIGADQTSVNFFIDAIDNPWLTGDKIVTFTVSADRFLPASDTLVVEDDPEDEPFPVVINEIRVDDDFSDGFEYFELYNKGSVPVSLDNLSYIVIGDGTGGSGVIENVTALSTGITLNPGEFYLVAKQASLPVDSDVDGDQIADFTAIPDQQAGTIAFENEDNLTHLLVYGFSGGSTQDLDTNDDGTLDATPWEFIADGIGLLSNSDIPPTGTEWAYGSSLGLLNIGPGTAQNGVPATSHVYRATDGGTWAVGPFGGAQNPDNSVLADVKDTPGISNVPTAPGNNFADWIDGFEVGLLTGFNDDFDNDGLDNALENILGSSPAVANQGLTAVSVSAGSLKFQHTLAAEVDIADDLTYEYEWSANLVNWQASGVEAGGITVTFGLPAVITAGVNGAPDLVEVTATVSGTGASKVFARLRADQVVAPQ